MRRYPIGGQFGTLARRAALAIALNSPYPGDPSSAVGVLDLPRPASPGTLSAGLPKPVRRLGVHARRNAGSPGPLVGSVRLRTSPPGRSSRPINAARRRTWRGAVMRPAGAGPDRRPATTAMRQRRGTPDGERRLGSSFHAGPRAASSSAQPVRGDRSAAVTLMAASLGNGTVALVDLRSEARVDPRDCPPAMGRPRRGARVRRPTAAGSSPAGRAGASRSGTRRHAR